MTLRTSRTSLAKEDPTCPCLITKDFGTPSDGTPGSVAPAPFRCVRFLRLRAMLTREDAKKEIIIMTIIYFGQESTVEQNVRYTEVFKRETCKERLARQRKGWEALSHHTVGRDENGYNSGYFTRQYEHNIKRD